ncbi:FecR family protein [Hymenobacter crusticola]|uniref:Uncharacterized protein n=1 Tax=Hymenobacter crusticola TaxID=1770526 RepID=A0A243W657_9BACT|nr:FecR domain-containing protein [Hymenobacter crusticola]OUJ69790.1 hypothetical protein BXP70_26130 [Hymenobacter crusticola]
MANLVTFDAFLRYARQQSSPQEHRAVRMWLEDPANTFLAQEWMNRYVQILEQEEGAPVEMPGFEAIQQELLAQLGLEEPVKIETKTRRIWWPQWAVAAVLLFGLLLGGAWFWQAKHFASPLPQTFAEVMTTYRQTRQVQLPDGSTVTLNANSTLRHAAVWNSNTPREVWLDGEAYFSVKHLPNHQRFRVHTSGNFNVEVLGTKFTVYRRHAQERVVLLSGKVRVDFHDHNRPDVILKPGELLQTADAHPKQVVHKAVKAPSYTAWTANKLVLDDTPISELATQLRDTYGLDVVVLDSALSKQTITGTVPVGDVDLLCQALHASFNIKVERQHQRILLSPL